MARTNHSTQVDEAAQTPPQHETPPPPPPPPPPPVPLLSMARIGLIMRIITLAFLILSVSLLASNSTTIRVGDSTTTLHFNDIYSYRYALATGVIGLSYTFLHLLSSIQQVRSGMLLANDPKILLYEFLGDKVILALVATGVGAAFGATVELKTKIDELEDAFEVYLDTTAFAPIVSKLDDFFNRAYFPTIFLLMAFLTIAVSSVLSSLALNNKTT
ncbi:CASP-like protein 4D1 [Salvia miltiorrhiza]|uniref:CASP-like protein 4D1 n=1 Tax=Salvia miltiorrhiza TaxID=226208 RepID=UPI0025AC001B|nr:CASP-like protein 4D1 [Salvia miltiorrhiza]